MLELKNISLNYSSVKKSFSLSIPEVCFATNKISCVLGKNGSGKTTLLNIIGGHSKPETGSIFLDGQDLTKLQANNRPCATVFQQLGLFPHMTVQQNIEIAIEPNALFKPAYKTKALANELIVNFGMEDLSDRLPKQLSIGQQQRTAILRGLSSNPQILLLDEPTSALDFVTIKSLKNTLQDLKRKQNVGYIIVVSHDLPFVMDIADSIFYIEDGEILFSGSVEEFKESTFYIN